jgi:carbon-monoxide dehydrogenase small subunit
MKVEQVTRALRINGDEQEIRFLPHKTLLEVLREDLDLTGTKHGCELGECGTCTVLLDGTPQLSCLTLALECEGRDITTIEGLARGPDPHPLQKRFAELGASQCGYCSPGFLLTAKSLLGEQPDADRETLKQELAGNLCRCTGYLQIFEAIEKAAADLRAEAIR